METTEFRIGDWYERNDFSKHQITIDDLTYLSKGEDIKRIHPISISDEIIKNSNIKTKPICDEEVAILYCEKTGKYDAYFNGYFLHEVEFVHEIQYLYRWWEGKELIINF
jgi:hypothetical protein